MRVLAYELNEVPWRVIEDFVKSNPSSAIARLVREAACYTTHTPDRGHLSPWITWPTMHRGVANTDHGIAFLGQDPKTFKYEPIWTLAERAGKTIGVFGSLQSWPPPPVQGRSFYVPDTFAQDERCYPPKFEVFQRFNLENVRQNGRVVQAKINLKSAAEAAVRLPLLGVRPTTILAGSRQILAEKMDPRRRYRRAVFQSILGFDIFMNAWKKAKPDYAAFFTNHVAGLMHRYWRATYPEDYPEGRGGDDPFYAEAISWGMQVADRHLAELMAIADRDPEVVLVVASSMGQHAIRPPDEKTTIKIKDLGAFMTALGYRGGWERRYAMEPQVPITFPDEAALQDFVARAATVTDSDGDAIFEFDRVDLTVSLTLRPSHHAVTERTLLVGTERGKQALSLEALGMEALEPETPGTAYHVPEGSLMIYGRKVKPVPGRPKVSTLSYAPTLLMLMGVPVPEHMKSPSLTGDLLKST